MISDVQNERTRQELAKMQAICNASMERETQTQAEVS